jgi:prophage regulatory protein
VKLIDFKELKPKKGIKYTRDHLRRKCRAGEFPQPVAISTARIAWIEAEIDAWLADKARARDQDEASRGEASTVSEMSAPDFVGEVVVEPAAEGVTVRADATDTEPISPSLVCTPAARESGDQRTSAIKAALNKGKTPGKNITWKEFCNEVRLDAGIAGRGRGYSDERIEKQTRAIMRQTEV